MSSLFQKIVASVINGLFVFALTGLFIPFMGFGGEWKIIFLATLFFYELLLLFTKSKRDLGMVVAKTSWKTPFTAWQFVLFNLLYTLSFATLLFYVKFPFDLFLCNMILLQLPAYVFTKKTFHGLISNMSTQNI